MNLAAIFSKGIDGELPEKETEASYDVSPAKLHLPLHLPKSYLSTLRRSARHPAPTQAADLLARVESVSKASFEEGHTLVSKTGPTSFVVRKHNTGRHFSVKVGAGRSCTCPECEASGEIDTKGRLCPATLYVLLKVLQIPDDSPLIYKEKWSGVEIGRVCEAANEQKKKIVKQNYEKPFKGNWVGGEWGYDDNYDERYGYGGYDRRDREIMGGVYGLDAQSKKGRTFRIGEGIEEMKAKDGSIMASVGSYTRNSGVGRMKSIDDMYEPPRNRVFAVKNYDDGSSLISSDVGGLPMIMPAPGTERSGRSGMSSARSDLSAASTESTATTSLETVEYPFFISGGRKVVQQGCVLPPGMKIRHPSLLYGKNFVHLIKEFLYVWDGTKGKEDKQFLAEKIRKLWISNSVFKMWASNVHGRSEERAKKLKKARLRLTVVMQNGTTVGVCVSPLVTGKEVCYAALRKRKMVNSNVNRRAMDMQLVFQGQVIDARRTMLDAGISDRSTLVMNFDNLQVNRKTRLGGGSSVTASLKM
ncbi:hypothetical protein TL16_g07996 [Triparma laevis f. inornata]|uniref:Ubiquitin-like domain-containing protein n=2 Tax=Triparma laevis TaxID=1534972 RepID=A0A9W7FB51_9STRA|nr:hypothetical protein TL16_g07996 [Triparma laevis f. inornata]GMI08925.1 hypothetical protein TrLO_g4713 [Triparma laevis f. longispina]